MAFAVYISTTFTFFIRLHLNNDILPRKLVKSADECSLLVDKVLALLDASLQLGNSVLDQLLFVLVHIANAQILRQTVLSQDQRSGKVGGLGHVRLDKGALHNLLTVHSAKQLNSVEGKKVNKNKESRLAVRTEIAKRAPANAIERVAEP